MMFVNIREVRDNLADYLNVAQKERVILMRYGKPVAILEGCEASQNEHLVAMAAMLKPMRDSTPRTRKRKIRRNKITKPKIV
jgi:antitoxin (DNA-binding transcriptional repressor) of toxin-antitoxin stability system